MLAERLLQELQSKLQSVDERVKLLEMTIAQLKDKQDKDGLLLQDFRTSVPRLFDAIEKIHRIEEDLSIISRKLLQYDVRFESIKELQKMVWAVLVVVIPGCIAVMFEVAKSFLQLNGHQ